MDPNIGNIRVQKFTKSCSRCRTSKLKCDGKVPCIECTRRNLGHLCTKDRRQPRAKRAQANQTVATGNALGPYEAKTTEAGASLTALENFVEGTTQVNLSSLMSNGLVPASSIAPDHPNKYWKRPGGFVLENEKSILIQEILHALPEVDVVDHIYDVFVTRCQGAIGNIFHTPTFLEDATLFRDWITCQATAPEKKGAQFLFSMETLACFLLALVLGLAFHPRPNILGWSATDMAERVEQLRLAGFHSPLWRSLALRCLRGPVGIFCGSIAGLQASIMLLLDGQEDALELDSVLVNAISGARMMGLHQLGDANLNDLAATSDLKHGMSPRVRMEVGVRIWWALVLRDWSRALSLGYYTIQPAQFNTRMPLHIDDQDIQSSGPNAAMTIVEQPRDKFTMLSYTVYAIGIATMAREAVDLECSSQTGREGRSKGRQKQAQFEVKQEDFINQLPSHFAFSSTVGLKSTGPLAAAPVQRWMLQQQLWSVFLRFHRGIVSPSHIGIGGMIAFDLIPSYKQVQGRCSVCDSLSTNGIQLFNAAVALIMDRVTGEMDERHGFLDRKLQYTKCERVQEAIELLEARNNPGSPIGLEIQSRGTHAANRRAVMVLRSLVKLADEGSLRISEHKQKPPSSSLKAHVLRIISDLSDLSPSTPTDQGHGQSLEGLGYQLDAMEGMLPDLDVLPMVSGDADWDFWQFLDLTHSEENDGQGLE